MQKLANIKCEACKPGAPLLTDELIKEYKPLIPYWEIIEENAVKKIKRKYLTKDFDTTIKFVNAIAKIAKEENHHPLMIVEYAEVTVFWWSHKIKGLHMNDFIMAAKCDLIFQNLWKN